jgi:hypothetical protein
MLIQYRRIVAVLLMGLGVAMLLRGLKYVFSQGLGWQGLIQASVVGVLVFALGFARWRYLRHR